MDTPLQCCEICGHYALTPFEAREMMFGYKDTFAYGSCGECKTIYQLEKLGDYSKYYPNNYYSFIKPGAPRWDWGRMCRTARVKRNVYGLTGKGRLGWLFNCLEPKPVIHRQLNLTAGSTILDVGCGSGDLIYQMAGQGFANVCGVDPFIKSDIEYENGARVYRGTLEEFCRKISKAVTGEALHAFDLIMFHHSFEHLLNPLETLATSKLLLKPGGRILIRVPVSGSYAALHYKQDWVQLDPPRHIYLFNEKSMGIIAGQSGLAVDDVYYDSDAFQFWASEQYQHNIPLRSPRSYDTSHIHSMFDRRDIRRFNKRARILNAQKMGDQAGFILRHA